MSSIHPYPDTRLDYLSAVGRWDRDRFSMGFPVSVFSTAFLHTPSSQERDVLMGSSGRVLDVRVVCTSVRSFSTFGRRVAVKKWNLYTIKWHVREGTANREGYNKKYDRVV